MTNLKNLEIINLSTIDGKLVATLSYQNPDDVSSVNNGYDTIKVPVNIREYQLSVRDNMLVDQSVKDYQYEAGPIQDVAPSDFEKPFMDFAKQYVENLKTKNK